MTKKLTETTDPSLKKSYSSTYLHIVKNSDDSDILPYSKVNELACHSFRNAGRRQKTTESGTKGYITYSNRNRVSAIIQVPRASVLNRAMRRGPGDAHIYRRGTLNLGKQDLL